MTGVTILDRDPATGALAFDLRDILLVLGDDGERSKWTVKGVECLGGDAAVALHSASEKCEVLAGSRLRALAHDVVQTVDGEFSAYLPNEDAAWITIRAVDSAAFDVETDREDILSAIRAHFDHVEEMPT